MSVVRNNVDLAVVPPPAARARVEIAMLEIIEQLQHEGLSVEEIALSLADASEDYVILLAREKMSTH
jgi:DNA-binding transcriptional MerR regulator